MKNILVAINFSKQSLVVFKYAMKIAQHFGATVDFIYVLPFSEIREEKGKYFDQIRAEKLQEIDNNLNNFIQTHYGKQYHSIQINTHVRIGEVSEMISNVANELNSDLLLVGKLFQRTFAFFGDTADNLISYCPCPVMTIPENIQYSAFKRIIYASAFLLEDCAAILELQHWLEIFKGELICINVSQSQSQLAIAKRKMSILERLFPQDNISFNCFVSEEGMAIENFRSLHEGDVLCTIHKDRNMFERLLQPSLSKDISNVTPRPMIVFHQHMFTFRK